MYSVSERFRTAMKKPVQRFRMVGRIGDISFSDENILSGSFSINGQCSDTSMVQIGQVYTNELKATFLKNLNLSKYSVKGAEVAPWHGIRLENGAYESVPLGVYTITTAKWTASGVEVVAYDNISKLDRTFTASSLTGTPFDLLTLACKNCGVPFGMVPSDFKNLANGERMLILYEDNSIETWRDVVAWIAQTLACNVFADRFGRIVLKAYNQTIVDTIDTEHRFTGSTFDDYETRYTGISVTNMVDDTTMYYGGAVDDALTYNLGSNPFLQTVDDGGVEDMCLEILVALASIRYVPFSASMIGIPVYDLMDVLSFKGGFADDDKISCITKYTFKYNGEYSIAGVGKDPALASSKSKTDKNLSGLMGSVNDLNEATNYILYDYNTAPIVVDREEQTIAAITYYVSKEADVEGHFMMDYRAEKSTHIIIRFYDTTVEELYSPEEMDVMAGWGTINIPHAFIKRAEGIHSVYVTLQCTVGEVYVDTRAAFFTLESGSYVQKMDEISMDVHDITMRQLMESNGPDEIWTIGIEKGDVIVSKRPYSLSGDRKPEWEGVINLEQGTAAAIEFDGEWVLRSRSQKFTLETMDQPWYFWVDLEGNLLAQPGEDEEKRLTLDTGVTAVSACRGYSSTMYLEQDQGLVVAYIKDGKPYYMQYVYDTTLEDKRWLQPELLINEEVDALHVHRLNDYRLGFELSTPTRNIWMYTSRTYVAQAVPKEEEWIEPTDKSMFLYTSADTDLSVEYTNYISEDCLTLKIFISKPIRYFYSWEDIIQFDDESIEHRKIDHVDIEISDQNAVITVHLKEPPKKLITTVIINPDNDSDLQLLIADYGQIKAPQRTLVFDTTIYRYVTIPDESIGIQNTAAGMAYNHIDRLDLSVTTEEAGITNTETGMSYDRITDILYSMETEEDTITLTADGMSYEQVTPAPI